MFMLLAVIAWLAPGIYVVCRTRSRGWRQDALMVLLGPVLWLRHWLLGI